MGEKLAAESSKLLLKGYNIGQYKCIQKNLKYLDIILSKSIENYSIEKIQQIILYFNEIEDIIKKIELLIDPFNKKSS